MRARCVLCSGIKEEAASRRRGTAAEQSTSTSRAREVQASYPSKTQPIPGNLGIPFMPPMRFIIFIIPPPFIFFIMSCICSNSLSRRFTS